MMIEKCMISSYCLYVSLFFKLSFQNDFDCGFEQLVICSGPCGHPCSSVTAEAINMTSILEIIEVNSFSNISITASTDEDSCVCQTLSECWHYFMQSVFTEGEF